jgi:uncharacterized DUF497 family protein
VAATFTLTLALRPFIIRRDFLTTARARAGVCALHRYFCRHVTFEDIRKDCGEPRYFSIGYFDSRMLVVVWTPRDGHERIISMRKANDREQRDYRYKLDR